MVLHSILSFGFVYISVTVVLKMQGECCYTKMILKRVSYIYTICCFNKFPNYVWTSL